MHIFQYSQSNKYENDVGDIRLKGDGCGGAVTVVGKIVVGARRDDDDVENGDRNVWLLRSTQWAIRNTAIKEKNKMSKHIPSSRISKYAYDDPQEFAKYDCIICSLWWCHHTKRKQL